MNNQEHEYTVDELMDNIGNQACNLEAGFIRLGQYLSEVKRRKTYLVLGFKTFKEFLDVKYSMNTTLANRLVSFYDVFVRQLNMYSPDIMEIGFDKLMMIKPFVADPEAPVTDIEKWVENARSLSIEQLKELVDETKKKNTQKTVKELFTEQFKDRMVTLFNCSAKELEFYFACFFANTSDDTIAKQVRINQRRFEEKGA